MLDHVLDDLSCEKFRDSLTVYDAAEIVTKAAECGNYDVVELLIANTGVPKNLDFAMLNACYGGHLDIVRLLVKYGARLEPSEYYSEDVETALSAAAARGHSKLVEYLVLEAGADVSDYRNHALCTAARNGHLQVCQFLLSHMMKKNQKV